jgi:hypothetical protein
MTRFLHFGCWNEFGCKTDTDLKKTDTDLKKTMDKLKIHITNNDIDFVVVAGDNYYPTKNDKVKPKIKKIETDLFLSGIKCLLDALKKESEKKIEKYILLGNHEYEDIKKIDNEEYDFMKCHILKSQKNIFEDQPDTYFFTDVMERKIGSTLILFIDSTIYEEKEEQNIKDTCFRHIFKDIKKEGTITIKDLCEYQDKKVISILDKYKDIKNLIVIAHHPIISIKHKKGENKQEKLDGLIGLYKKIHDQINDKKINLYHLCADTHTYQQGTIKITYDDDNNILINQYICGTGGAHKDLCPITDVTEKKEGKKKEGEEKEGGEKEGEEKEGEEKESKKKEIEYIINECKEVNGFLDVYISEIKTEEPIVFTFIEATQLEQHGGYYNKYLKYKTKYLKLKQNF